MSEDMMNENTVEGVVETPTDPNLLGELPPEQANEINMLRQVANTMTMELGQFEIRKARTLNNIGEIEQKLQAIVDRVKTTFEIDDAVTWQVTPEGKVLRTESTDQAPPQ